MENKKKIVIFFICLDLKLEMEKMILSIKSKNSYFKPVFNYTRKGL